MSPPSGCNGTQLIPETTPAFPICQIDFIDTKSTGRVQALCHALASSTAEPGLAVGRCVKAASARKASRLADLFMVAGARLAIKGR